MDVTRIRLGTNKVLSKPGLLERYVQILNRSLYLAVAVERVFPEFLEYGREDSQLVIVFIRLGLVVVGRPADPKNRALLPDRELAMVGFYSFGSVPYSCLYFFMNSFSTCNRPICL
ncbi:MAG TPA: hypothetical protein PLI66_04550 [Spirochaetales bacterium]|nr:hypothetical protein [Spirochaetales bacterium]